MPFLIGLFILLGATLILWLASNIPAQIIGRSLQGFASTVVWTTGLAVLVDTVGQEHIGEYMGYVGIALNAGTLIAPFLGGIIFARCGYNAVYGLIIGIVGLDILLRLIMVEQVPMTFDMKTKAAVIENDVELGPAPLKKTPTISIDQISIASDTTLGPTSAPSKFPAILRLLYSARFIAAIWGTMVLAATFSAFQAVLPLMVHETFSWDAIGAGLIFLPLSLPAIAGPVIGKFTDRLGGRWFALAGFVLLCISLVLLRFITTDSTEHKALLCVLLVMVGSCMALILEPLMAEITSGASRLDKRDRDAGFEVLGSYSQALALFNMAWASGNAVGPVLGGLVMEAAGWQTMTWTLGLLAGISAVPVGLWIDGWYFEKRDC